LPKRRCFADIAEAQRELLVALDSISIRDFRQFPAVGAVLGSLHLQTFTSLLNNFFFYSSGIFWFPPRISAKYLQYDTNT
jgi:hypothetical protein